MALLFRITPGGKLTVLHNFCPDPPNCDSGDVSFVGVVEGLDGNFYGVTPGGGANNAGVIFELSSTTGIYNVLLNFCANLNWTDGANPKAGKGCGVVFKFVP
jgi:uncharacterized repeat protein (TIGR03803 family)